MMLCEDRNRLTAIICVMYCITVFGKCVETEKINLEFIDVANNESDPLHFSMKNSLKRWHSDLSRQRYRESREVETRNGYQLTDESLGALKIISLLPTSYGKVWRSSSEESSSPQSQLMKRTSRLDFHEPSLMINFERTKEGTAVTEHSNMNNQPKVNPEPRREHHPSYRGSKLPTNKQYEFKHQMGERPNLMEARSENVPFIMSYKKIDERGNGNNFHTYWLHSRVTPSRTTEKNLTGDGKEATITHEYVYLLEDQNNSKVASETGTRRVWFDPKFSQNHQWPDQKYPLLPELVNKDSHLFPVKFDERLSDDAARGFETAGLNIPHSKIIHEEKVPIIYNSHQSKVFAVDTGRYTSNFKVIQENKRGTVPSFEIAGRREELFSPHGTFTGGLRAQEVRHVSDAGKQEVRPVSDAGKQEVRYVSDAGKQEKRHISDGGKSLQTEKAHPQRAIINTRQRSYHRPNIPRFKKNVDGQSTHWKTPQASDYRPNIDRERELELPRPKLETHMFRYSSGTRHEDKNDDRHAEYKLGHKKREDHSRPPRTMEELHRGRPVIPRNRWGTKGALRMNPEITPMHRAHDTSDSKTTRTGGPFWVRARDVLVDRSTDNAADQKFRAPDDNYYAEVSQDRSTSLRRQSVEEKYGSIVAGAAVAVGLAAFAVTAMGNNPMAKETLDILPSLGTLSNVFREADKRIAREQNYNLSRMEPVEPDKKNKLQAEPVHHLTKIKRMNIMQNPVAGDSGVLKNENKSVSQGSEVKEMSVILETIHDKKSTLNTSSIPENSEPPSQLSKLAEMYKRLTHRSVKMPENLNKSASGPYNMTLVSFNVNDSSPESHVSPKTPLRTAESRNYSETSVPNITKESIISSHKPKRNVTLHNSLDIVELSAHTTNKPDNGNFRVVNASQETVSTGPRDYPAQSRGGDLDPEGAESGFGGRPSHDSGAAPEEDSLRQHVSTDTLSDVRSSETIAITTIRSDILDQPREYAISTWIPVLNSRSINKDSTLFQSTSILNETSGNSYFGTSEFRKVLCTVMNCDFKETKRIKKRSVSTSNLLSHLVDPLYNHQHDGSKKPRTVDSESTVSAGKKTKTNEKERTRNKSETREVQIFSEEDLQDSSEKLSVNNEKSKSETTAYSKHPQFTDTLNRTSPRKENLQIFQTSTSSNSAHHDMMNVGLDDPNVRASALESRIEVYSDDHGKNSPAVGKPESGNYSVTTQSQTQVLSPTSWGLDRVTPATLFIASHRSDAGASREGAGAEPLRRGTHRNESSSERSSMDNDGRRKWARNLLVENKVTDSDSGDNDSGHANVNFGGKKEREKILFKSSYKSDERKNQDQESEEKLQQSELKRIIEKYRLSKFIKELYERKRINLGTRSDSKDNFTVNDFAFMDSARSIESFFLPGAKVPHEGNALALPPNNSVLTSRESDFTGHVRTGSMPHKILLFLLEQYKEKLDQIRRYKVELPSLQADEQNSKHFSTKPAAFIGNISKKNSTVIGAHGAGRESKPNEEEENAFETNKLYAITDISEENDPVLEELIVLEHDPNFDLSHERFQRKLTPKEKEEAQGLLALFNTFLQKNLIKKRSSFKNINNDYTGATERSSRKNSNYVNNKGGGKKDWQFDSSSELSRDVIENEENSQWDNRSYDQEHVYYISGEEDLLEDTYYSSEVPEYFYYPTDSFEERKHEEDNVDSKENQSFFDSIRNSSAILDPDSLMKVLLEFEKLSRDLEEVSDWEENGSVEASMSNHFNPMPKSRDASKFRSWMPAEISADAFEEFVSDLSKSLNKHNEWSLSSNFPPVKVSIPSVWKHEGIVSQVQSSDGTQSRKTGQRRDFMTHNGRSSEPSVPLRPNDVREIAKERKFSNAPGFKTRNSDRLDESRFNVGLVAKNEKHQSEIDIDSNFEDYAKESHEDPIAYHQKLHSNSLNSVPINEKVNLKKGFSEDDNLAEESLSKILRNLNGTSKFLDTQESTGKNSGEYAEPSTGGGSANSSGFGVSSLLSILNPNKPDILRNINKVLDLIIGDSGEKDVEKSTGKRGKYALPTVYDFPKSRSSPLHDEGSLDTSHETKQLENSNNEDLISPTTEVMKNNYFATSPDQRMDDIERSLFSPELDGSPESSPENHVNTFNTTNEERDSKLHNNEKINSHVRFQFGANIERNKSFTLREDSPQKFYDDLDSIFTSNERDSDVYHDELFFVEPQYSDYLFLESAEMGSSERPSQLSSSSPGDGVLELTSEERKDHPQNVNFVQESQLLPKSRGALPNSLVFEGQRRDEPQGLHRKRGRSDTFSASDYEDVNKNGYPVEAIGDATRTRGQNSKMEIQDNKDLSLKPSVLLTAQRLAPSNRREYNPSFPDAYKQHSTNFNPSSFDVQYFNSSGQWRAIQKPSISKAQTHFKSRSNQPFIITPYAGDFTKISTKKKLVTETRKAKISKSSIIPSHYDESSGFNITQSKFDTFLSQDQKGRKENVHEKISAPHLVGRNPNHRTSVEFRESTQKRKHRLNQSLKSVPVRVADTTKPAVEFAPVKKEGMQDSRFSLQYPMRENDSGLLKSGKNSLGVLTSMAANSRGSADHIFIDVGFKYPVHAEWAEAQEVSSLTGHGTPNSSVTTFVINDGGVLRAAASSDEMLSSLTVNSKATFARPQNSNDIGRPLTNGNRFSTFKFEKTLNEDGLPSYNGENIADSALLKSNSDGKDHVKLSYSPAYNEIPVSNGTRLTTTALSLLISVLISVYQIKFPC